MTRAEAEQIVTDVLRQVAPEADLALVQQGGDMRRVLDLDSVDLLTLLERVAERTGIEVPESAYGQVATFAGLVDYLMVQS